MEPGKRHAIDLESVEMRINENSSDDGIECYTRATDQTGDGFLLVVITLVQQSWLGKYSRRGICIDDTFNLTRYSLRLATVIVADQYDMGLPGAYLLSNRMTEDEVYKLFVTIKGKVPNFDPKLFTTDDTNSFYNGFLRAFPSSFCLKVSSVLFFAEVISKEKKPSKWNRNLCPYIHQMSSISARYASDET
ncbi:hypothetical protein OSTOST_04610 [Ostertagia ostertagi]